MRLYRFGLLGLIVAAALQGGCKAPPPPIIPIEAVVLINGQPLPNAQVRFVPMIEYGPQYIAVGVTDEKGELTLSCNGQPGACACENIITVMEADIPEKLQSESAQKELAEYLNGLKNRPIPAKYSNLADTPLRVTIAPGQQLYEIELER